jgi:hypothetical protein
MDNPSPFRPTPDFTNSRPVGEDPRLQPTPDWGNLGPGTEVAGWEPSPERKPVVVQKPGAAVGPLLAALATMFAGLLFVVAHRDRPAGEGLTDLFSTQPPKITSAHDTRQLDRMRPQNQAEALLGLAVANSDGAVEEIESRVDQWQGKVRWNSQIASLSAAALNSKDTTVRESGVEVELVAYGLAKNSASLNYLLKTAESSDHAQKIWALWALGLMGNRGVETDQVVQVLTNHLQDSDEESRRWAVEGLALTGADGAIEPLLKAMHDDPAAEVRGRAACGIAEAGLFSPVQRSSAIPQLLRYTDDPALDAQTQGWAFHALSDITHRHMPNDAAAWRKWYEATKSRD